MQGDGDVPQDAVNDRAEGFVAGERRRPEWLREHPQAWRFAVGTVCFGAFMGQLDASIVTLTYGSLRREFDASLASVQWVSLGYLVVLAALLVPVGRLSDAHGRKLYYLYGFALFTAASVACGLAWSLWALVLFRVLQAVGAALLQSNSVALVVTSTPRRHLRQALGMQAGAQALGLALGPTVGGLLVSTAGWRWVFGINVPVGVVAFVAGQFLLPRTRGRRATTSFDWPGVVLLGTSITTLLLALSVVSGMPWPLPSALALLVVAVAAGVALVIRQRRAPEPLVEPGLLRLPGVVGGLVGALAGYLVLFGPLVLVPVVLEARGLSALTAGLVLTALPLGFAVAAVAGQGLLPATWGNRARCSAGAVLCAVALAAMAVEPASIAGLAPTLFALGVGLGVFTPANNSMVMTALPASASGTGGGLVNTTRGLGTALGVALVTLTLQLSPPEGSAAGARWAIALLLAFAVLSLVATTVRRGGSEDRSPGAGEGSAAQRPRGGTS